MCISMIWIISNLDVFRLPQPRMVENAPPHHRTHRIIGKKKSPVITVSKIEIDNPT